VRAWFGARGDFVVDGARFGLVGFEFEASLFLGGFSGRFSV
jgi:hypothetical protein